MNSKHLVQSAIIMLALFGTAGCVNYNGQLPPQLHGTTPQLGWTTVEEAFEITDVSDLITDEYQHEIEAYIPFWAQSSDGSVVIHIRGPQAEPDFSASWLLVPNDESRRILVVQEGWAGQIMELSRQWAFDIRGEDGINIFPTEVQFIRYDADHENTILPTVVDGEWKDQLN